MSFDNEPDFEQAIIAELTRHGWSKRILRYPTEEELVKNWADILFHNNNGIDCLNDQPLTEGEMRQILNQVEELKTPLALNSFINGKSVTITRDNPADKLHFGKDVSLTIYDRLEIAAGKSCYQIAEQPRFERHKAILPDRRGDFMLLINGMPVIHVELKSSKVPAMQAANQIGNYSHEGVFTGLFSLVQIFVAMNPEEMLYFANPGKDGKFNRDYYFHWADFNNEPVNDWKKLASIFLSIPMAHQMIGFYTVADQGDATLKVLRSYQYYAANAISNKVAKIDWTEENQLGGYIWHTTGSGKTLTSFKSAQLIANSGDADKVVFLADRIELGTQSLQEYRGFADATQEVQATENTDALVATLKSELKKDTLIVTSIQKMSRVNAEQGNRRKADLDKIRRKRIVVIIDECHRSVFGDMLAEIKATFPNAVLFGFSGTPIQAANKKKMSTTCDIFGNELHRYTIADGLRDKNVLGFDPHMVLTYKDSDLRQAVALDKAKAHTVEDALNDERRKEVYLRYMNPAQTPMAGHTNPDGSYTRGIEDEVTAAQYNCDSHRRNVVKDIKAQWTALSQNGKFHALLATSSIPEAIEYYRLLRKEMPRLNVTALFDPNIDNTGNEEFKEDGLVEIIDGYNRMFATNYTMPTHAAMKKNISLRLAHKKPFNKIEQSPEQQIDLLIVVDQMLTGFDSKWINTLYLDKLIEHEHLIQAFSRTNRLFGIEKPFGTIKYYRFPHTMKRNIDIAVKEYSGDCPTGMFAQPLIRNLQQLNNSFGEIGYLFDRAGIDDFERLPNDNSERGRFAKLFRTLNTYLEAAKIQGFRWSKQNYTLEEPKSGKTIRIKVALDETTYLILAKRYKELFATTGGSGGSTVDVAYDIDPSLAEIDTGLIDANYMNSRFEKFIKTISSGNASAEERTAVMEELHKSFATLSQDEQHYANIFIHDVESGNVKLETGKTFKDYVVEYQLRDKNDQIHRMALLLGIDEPQLRTLINSNVTSKNIDEFNRFSLLLKTVDRNKARQYFTIVDGCKPSPFKLSQKIDNLLRRFVIDGELPTVPQINIAKEELPVAADSRPLVNEALLVGAYKGQEQLEWIRANRLYNVRAFSRRGAVKSETNAKRASHLLLYDVDNPAIHWLFSLTDQIDHADEQAMRQLNYPRIRENGEYFLYHIAQEKQCPNVDVAHLINNNKDDKWTKGKPIYIPYNKDLF